MTKPACKPSCYKSRHARASDMQSRYRAALRERNTLGKYGNGYLRLRPGR